MRGLGRAFPRADSKSTSPPLREEDAPKPARRWYPDLEGGTGDLELVLHSTTNPCLEYSPLDETGDPNEIRVAIVRGRGLVARNNARGANPRVALKFGRTLEFVSEIGKEGAPNPRWMQAFAFEQRRPARLEVRCEDADTTDFMGAITPPIEIIEPHELRRAWYPLRLEDGAEAGSLELITNWWYNNPALDFDPFAAADEDDIEGEPNEL
ncbi:hypothetical protein CTAYLR_006221 [Chrysophaeum taylorii]|uniref:C2 domain-containing protein n=1 Tax=Chrysophaeum taylorii TaxID=2483200 RepID=A0AAD7U940_9STRA|nr:hypothetical protein CTAYLR_006221 [Chrysophaeum taylorii]